MCRRLKDGTWWSVTRLRYRWRVSRLPDEVGQRLVKGPVVLRELGSVIGSGAVMIYIFAGSGGGGRGHLHCCLAEMAMTRWEAVTPCCSQKVQSDKKPEICHFVRLSFSRFTILLLTVHFIIKLVIKTQKTCKLIALKMYKDKQTL